MIQDIIKPLNLARGFFFKTEFSATGGVKYRRMGEETQEKREDESMTAEWATRKDVDHVGLMTWSRRIVNAAYNVMEKHCSQTPIGYWISEERAPKVLEELAGIKMEARKLNDFAKTVRSLRHVTIEVYATQVGQEDMEKAAVRLAETVRERLGSLREDLFRGDLNAYATSWKRAKNINRLATGIQAETVVMALEAAREARKALAEKLGDKMSPERAGGELNLDMLDSAIVLFTDNVNGTQANVEDSEIGV
jgi:hypothetical protein